MLNIPEEVKTLFSTDGVNKNFHVHFPNGETSDLNNENILSESVKFTESLCSQQYFKFGLAEASQIEFTAVGIPNILGAVIDCAMEIDCTSLGSAWAEEHPIDDTLDWLEPQTCIAGREYEEQTGNLVSFSIPEGKTAKIENLILDIEAVQSGSGNPTPTNVRPITGWDSATVYVSPTEDSADGDSYTFDWTTEAGTVYGGKLNANTGLLTITHLKISGGELTWVSTGGGNSTFYSEGLADQIKRPSSVNEIPDIMCSAYTPKESINSNVNNSISVIMTNGRIHVRDTRYTTIGEFRAAIADVVIVYALAEPIEVQLTAQEVERVFSQTYVWQTCGTIAVKFVTYTDDTRIRYRIPYGRFIVDSCPRNHGAMAQRKITAFSEELIGNVQFISGQYPRSKININPLAWVEAQLLDDSEMTEVSLGPGYDVTYALPNLYTSNGSDFLSNIFGFGVAGIVSSSGHINSGPAQLLYVYGSQQNKKIALKFRYEKHEFDDYSKNLYEAFVSSVPNKAYIYADISTVEGTTVWSKRYSNTKQAVFSAFCCLSPSIIALETWYTEDHTRRIDRYSKPIFIESNELYVLDLGTSFDYFSKVPSNYYLSNISLYAFIPTSWQSSAEIECESGYVNISGWENAAPFDGQTRVVRSGDIKAYYKILTAEDTVPNLSIQNTLKFKKCTSSGNYYTFANAVSSLGVVKGIMELTGEFLKVSRTGEHNFFKISENQTLIPISRSDWEEFWWDENDVDPIGTVNAKFSDDENSGEESIMTFTIGDGASVYTMEDNVVLENSTASQTELQAVIDQYFAPNASVINFTPVDLGMRGLPYLESGDYIQLTAEDGTTVNTYILEQTISGIQHLTADITSTNGELLEVMEDE